MTIIQKQFATLFVTTAGLLLFLSGCGSGNTNNASRENTGTLSTEIADTSYIPRNLISTPVLRAEDPSSPAVKIDLTRPNSRYGTFDLADHFKKATVKILSFPGDSGSFVYDKHIGILFKQGMTSFNEQSDVKCENGFFIVYDHTNGILQYDSTGNYIGTVYKNNLSGLKYNKRYKYWDIPVDRWNTCTLLPSIGKYTLYLIVDSLRKGTIGIWDPEQRATIRQQVVKRGHPLTLPALNDTVRYQYRHTAFEKGKEKPMLYFFNAQGDTLNKVQDYIALTEIQHKNYSGSADNPVLYRYNHSLHFRQPYSDTLFRILSPDRMQPAYIIDFGKQKPTMDMGYYGDKSNSFMLQKWSETNDLIYIIYSKNYDCQTNRNNQSVTFYYALYYKQNGQLVYLDMKGKYPEEALLPNSLPGSLPLSAKQFYLTGEGKIGAHYFKEDLQKMIQSPVFATLPVPQQERIKQLGQELGPRKIAIMVIE